MISADWKNRKNILCIRLDNLGDVLMTQPALRALKRSLPQARLTLLASGMGAGMAKMLPEPDDVLVFDPPWVKLQDSLAEAENVSRLVEQLKERSFDAAIIFTNFSQSALPAAVPLFLARIPLVLGYCRENPYQLINNWLPDHEPFAFVKHGVQRQLDLVRAIGATTDDDKLCLPVSIKAGHAVLQKLRGKGLDLDRPWLALHPGTTDVRRQYPAKLYAQAVGIINKELGMQVVLTGVKEERHIAQEISQNIRRGITDLVGQLPLEELVALLSQARLLISNNTGPVHIAAALQTPVVVLYGRTNPEHTPWKARSAVLYFDVPKELRSKNALLAGITPSLNRPLPQPQEIAACVENLLKMSGKEKPVSREVSTWI